ncbi:hypothetical protein BDI4_710043 [Burkholderia diffusa]|nr:hypothetical protein BDI4_710043 [Burkholderia diffusa]
MVSDFTHYRAWLHTITRNALI